jgi:hypothetical protein
LEQVDCTQKKTREKASSWPQSLDIDFVDADFCDLWPARDKHDPVSVKVAQEVVCIANFCLSGQQTTIYDFTKHNGSEYAALSDALKFVIPVKLG